jgi:uncharacterized protein YkwD
MRSAKLKAQHEVDHGYYGHFFEGTSPQTFLDLAGYSWRSYMENLSLKHRLCLSRHFVEDWHNSPPHRRAMLAGSPYSEMGAAVLEVHTVDEAGRRHFNIYGVLHIAYPWA